VSRRSRQDDGISRSERARLAVAADPDCAECDGSGVVGVLFNNNPDREQEFSCACTIKPWPGSEDSE
jgi:hypothetical protein